MRPSCKKARESDIKGALQVREVDEEVAAAAAAEIGTLWVAAGEADVDVTDVEVVGVKLGQGACSVNPVLHCMFCGHHWTLWTFVN